jgi:hypothetical protein
MVSSNFSKTQMAQRPYLIDYKGKTITAKNGNFLGEQR